MFHANAWGLPYACVMVGAKMVLPGPHLDPESLTELFEAERVTVTAGVPTIWMGMLQWLDANPGRRNLSSIRAMVIGGSAAPKAMIEAYDKRHGLQIVHAWGMTETSPLGSVSTLTAEAAEQDEAARYACRATQGRPAPFVEIRARGDQGFVPWDGASMGELEVRGPWVASGYYLTEGRDDRFTDDGWFRTGDIVTIAADGYISIQDRAKDVIKSGGEWISSIALENAAVGHSAVAEAGVIAAAHEKWQERPLLIVVRKPEAELTRESMLRYLEGRVAKWWLPDDVVFVEELPHTATGKLHKMKLRERFRDYRLPTA
jgi:fatty-acyl-CoA synthase